MSHAPPLMSSMASPASEARDASEKSARQDIAGRNSAQTPKQRSCVICRSRKVRCDKQSPCSNCRRANIACTLPPTDRPPRWARRLERVTAASASNSQISASQSPDPAAVQVMERLRTLESLVKELSGQLEQANAAARSAAGGSSGVPSPGNSDHQREGSPSDPSSVQKQFGRLVVHDANRSRYVSSGFWSRVDDELHGLKMDSRGLGAGDDSDTSEDDDVSSPGKSSSTRELERTPSDRHAFLFRHNLSPSAPDLREFHPLPSQIPFLLDVFSENVNSLTQVVHMPTIVKMVRSLQGNMTKLSSNNEALIFSIYYAAITSMEEDDIMTNFGLTKTDLNLKYRLGLEYALANADFLNVPDFVLVQAFAIFLTLARRHDSPRFVWMMAGLLIRMSQALGLHRDGTNFGHLTPYEIEMRRRLWFQICMIDVRASEDQGTEYSIALGSFDTKHPLNINDSDISPETKEMPTAREGLTDMTFSLVSLEMGAVMKRIVTMNAREGAAGMEEQNRTLDEIYEKLDKGYLQYTVESGNIMYWVGVCIARLVMAKMTMFICLPVLFSAPDENSSDQIKNKLLVAAIEIAEYNHALNAEEGARAWRWVYQSYVHWYSIVYLLLETSRRSWSPVIERAWMALHSEWLIPAQAMDKNQRIWIPLRKLTAKAKKHRDAELERLRNDPRGAQRLEMDDQYIAVPGSPGLFPTGSDAAKLVRQLWRKLVGMPDGFAQLTNMSMLDDFTPQQNIGSTSGYEYSTAGLDNNVVSGASYPEASGFQTGQILGNDASADFQIDTITYTPDNFSMGQKNQGESLSPYNISQGTWSGQGAGLVPWLWADTDPSAAVLANVNADPDFNMDLDSNMDMDWYNWVENAKGMELP